MSKLVSKTQLSNITDLPGLIRFVSSFFVDLEPIINGRVEFDQNIRSQTISVLFPTANTDLAITHSLGKTGVNFFVVNKSVSLDVYHGAGTDTSQTIYLKSTVAGSATIVLF